MVIIKVTFFILIFIGAISLLVWALYGSIQYNKKKRLEAGDSVLITCKDCKKLYSPDAPRCIHCGARKPANPVKVWGWILAGVAFWAFLTMGGKEKTLQEKACTEDWKKCANNGQLVDNYKKYSSIRVDCKNAAKKQAAYGTPDFPWLSFSNYHVGTNYIETGTVYAIEENAKFQNEYGAMAKVKVVCVYDLNKEAVTSVYLNP